MMKDQTILQELERLAAACPWDQVDIWISRQPAGLLEWTTYVRENEALGFRCVFGHGKTLEAAVSNAIDQCRDRDPEKQRKAKIAELQLKLMKLQQMRFDLPPYRAPNQIGYGERVCDTCKGLGQISVREAESDDYDKGTEVCPKCKGTGVPIATPPMSERVFDVESERL